MPGSPPVPRTELFLQLAPAAALLYLTFKNLSPGYLNFDTYKLLSTAPLAVALCLKAASVLRSYHFLRRLWLRTLELELDLKLALFSRLRIQLKRRLRLHNTAPVLHPLLFPRSPAPSRPVSLRSCIPPVRLPPVLRPSRPASLPLNPSRPASLSTYITPVLLPPFLNLFLPESFAKKLISQLITSKRKKFSEN